MIQKRGHSTTENETQSANTNYINRNTEQKLCDVFMEWVCIFRRGVFTGYSLEIFA